MAEDKDDPGPADPANFWQIQLGLADKDQQDWQKDGLAVVSRYKNEKKAAQSREAKKFNILYSNTETLKSALYGKTAKPDVRRRFGDKDVIARTAAEVIERALVDCAEVYDVDKPIEKGIHDYLLPGRGLVRIEYEPVFGEQPCIDMATGQPMMDGGKPKMQKCITDQIVRERYIYWDDYRQSPSRTWDDVWWVAFRHLMTREDLTDNKFEKANEVPLNWAPMAEDKRPVPDDLKRAEVWEIWDSRERERLWIVKGWPSPLRTDDDPYGLEQFFPMPEPLIAFGDTATQVPTPPFHTYRDQADDLDECAARISRLTKALKRRGVYDKAVKELARLSRANDNEFIPVDNYAALSQKGGLQAAFQSEDISLIAMVLKELYVQRDNLIQGIYEITGIADIMRGSSDPNETLGAQKIKAQFGSTRLKRMQRAVQKWIAALYKLKAEIIAEHFEPNVLQQMTGQQIDPQVIQLLRSDKLRSYRIDIETDSTVFEDAQAEQQARTEMTQGVTQFITAWGPVVSERPELIPLAFELLSFALKPFKVDKGLEDTIEQAKDALTQASQQPKPPDPKIAADAQIAQQDLAVQQQKIQMEGQAKQAELSIKAQHAERELELKREELDIKRQTAAMELRLKQDMASQDMAMRQQEMHNQGELETRKIDAAAQAQERDHGLQRDMKAQEFSAAEQAQARDHGHQSDMEAQKAKPQVDANSGLIEAVNAMKDIAKLVAAPKRHVRGADGRITHSEPMVN